MTITSLRTLVAQVPSWQNRLDELVAEITTRQDELSKIERDNAHDPTAPTRPEPDSKALADTPTSALQAPDNMNIDPTPSAGIRQQTAHSIGGNGPPTKKKKLGPVYFDGNMQKFFEELVQFLAVSRNMMRKAKMAARVAQIKKMAEVQVNDEFGDGVSDQPTLRYVSARRLDSLGPAREPDVFDALDKNLETLQTTSELAAFQFLREASYSKHMETIKKILGDALDTATAELARLTRDEPDMAREADTAVSRIKRPRSMRNELLAGTEPVETSNKRQNTGHLTPSGSPPSIGHMEVDLAALQSDEPISAQVIHLSTNVRA
ncbi:hypothetical protein ISF_03354 [Cordyceps fumosorosea ARSEF 2679]|uniref:Uncharacterized protein n=1 Tax=Cordyceps fumosorosea (strain ARSEF 2679) TaxID=1081104 RepID=A0A162MRA7_CORFA|nr:hypothetical protein ISF_03354 [Cordyceps fumosorosea ARSEF 2679]OAA68979.1 hypothetical protein ISF_03354 [Cordyceps fumosorosea ARSEF 2679]